MIKEYLEKWNASEAPKPANDPGFIADFLSFLGSREVECFEFGGENHYCGYTAIVYEDNPRHCFGRVLGFELAYGVDFVKVFTASHNGFWVPEYICLKGSDALPILAILKSKYLEWGCFA